MVPLFTPSWILSKGTPSSLATNFISSVIEPSCALIFCVISLLLDVFFDRYDLFCHFYGIPPQYPNHGFLPPVSPIIYQIGWLVHLSKGLMYKPSNARPFSLFYLLGFLCAIKLHYLEPEFLGLIEEWFHKPYVHCGPPSWKEFHHSDHETGHMG